MDLFPAIDPYDHGWLDVGDGQRIYWESCGNRRGEPALVVHGGPGTGCTPRMRRAFDPEQYRILLFDQRGSGRSLPHASDLAVDLSRNTTQSLLADMEKLRQHLGVERWLLSAGSWGCTLAVAYAEQHPERVSALVLSQVSLSRRREIQWLYGGLGRFFPEEWRALRDGVPEAEGGDLVAAYARRLQLPGVCEAAARSWLRWEEAALSLEPRDHPRLEPSALSANDVAFARICAHYYSNAAWLSEDELLGGAARLSTIPGVIIHGRLDLSCPFETAWELAQAWPTARLCAPTDAGHGGSASKRRALLEAHAAFARGGSDQR